MKRISKNILFVLMGILCVHNSQLQSALAATAALRNAAPIIEGAATVGPKIIPAVAGFFKACGQAVKTATIKITQATLLAGAGYGYSQYENGQLVPIAKGAMPPVTGAAIPSNNPAYDIFSFPKQWAKALKKLPVETTEERWFPRWSTTKDFVIDWTTNNFIAEYMKKSSPGEWIATNPEKSRIIATWFIAGFFYEDYYKKRQIEQLNTKMNKGISDGITGQTKYGTTWTECQAILAATGNYPNTSTGDARVYIDAINNGSQIPPQKWYDTVVYYTFFLHPYVLYKKLART